VNFRTLDLNLLRVFDAVMTEGSLTRAAQVLALTQPAVSHALRRLHDAAGAELMVRTAHGMRPTALGESMWPQVREALGMLEQLISPAEFRPRDDHAHFRLAMADATAAMIAPALVAAIEQQQALANLRMLPLTTRDPRPLIEHGEADVAVGYFPAAITALVAEGDEALLRHRLLYDTEYVCVMRREHPLAHIELSLDAFCAAHHLLVSLSGRPHGFVDEALNGLGRRRRIVLTVNQFFTAGRVVTRSDLLTVLPASFVASTGYRHELVTRRLPMDLGRVHVEMLWHGRHDRDPAQRWLRERIDQAVSAEFGAPAGTLTGAEPGPINAG
jgi:DNA-binding transcriptional LysR family regulator